jgi:hypothetical protein
VRDFNSRSLEPALYKGNGNNVDRESGNGRGRRTTLALHVWGYLVFFPLFCFWKIPR